MLSLEVLLYIAAGLSLAAIVFAVLLVRGAKDKHPALEPKKKKNGHS